MNYKFPKKEHLCGKKEIGTLFAEGTVLFLHPFRIVYKKNVLEEGQIPARIMISVPKKKFKLAVKRNRIKRLIRESYRLNKNDFVNCLVENNIALSLVFQYISSDEPTFQKLEKKMKPILAKIEEKVVENA